jgi:hypothetical protein
MKFPGAIFAMSLPFSISPGYASDCFSVVWANGPVVR